MKAHLCVSKESEEKCFLAWEHMAGVPAFPSVSSGSAWSCPSGAVTWQMGAPGSCCSSTGEVTLPPTCHIWVQEPHQAAQQCVRSQGLKDEALPKFQVVSSYCFSLSFVKYSVCLKR